jgi:lipopolysaccharide heptosyltransferase II
LNHAAVHALRRILVLRLSSLGDVVLITPFLRGVKALLPQAEIHVAVRAEYADLLSRHPAVARLHLVERGEGIDAVRARLRTMAFDAVFDLQGTLRSRLLGRGLAPRVYRAPKRTLDRMLLVALKWNRLGAVAPVAERYFLAAAAFGVLPDGHPADVHIDEEWTRRVRAALAERGLAGDAPLLAFAPGARHATKRWPLHHAREFCSLVSRRSPFHLLLLGSRDEAPLAAELERHAAGRAVNLCGALSLGETAAALSLCRGAVTNDSGLMHLATARGTPVVALFGSTVREFGFFPYAARARVLEVDDLRCRPCHRHGRARCPRGHFACMERLAPEAVWQAVASLLDVSPVN